MIDNIINVSYVIYIIIYNIIYLKVYHIQIATFLSCIVVIRLTIKNFQRFKSMRVDIDMILFITHTSAQRNYRKTVALLLLFRDPKSGDTTLLVETYIVTHQPTNPPVTSVCATIIMYMYVPYQKRSSSC